MHEKLVFRLLDAKNGFPGQKDFIRAGKLTETNRILTNIAVNKNQRDRIRLNAIRALTYFKTIRTREVLMGMLYAKKQKIAYVNTCMRALSITYGVDMYFELLPFLQDLRPAVRSGAARALGEIDDSRVTGILNNHLLNESSIDVRTAIENALKMVQKREAAKEAARLEKLIEQKKAEK